MMQEDLDSPQESQWSDERILSLISEIEQLRFLWDPRDEDKKNKSKKRDAFKCLADKFGVTAEELKKKYFGLLQSYRTCRRKIKKSKASGAGRSNVYKPVWFAYEALNKFMEDVYTPHGVKDRIKKEVMKSKKKLSTDAFDPVVDEAYYQCLLKKRNEETGAIKEKDECAIFGELIAEKLRKMDEITRQYVMNDINNLMFKAIIRRTTFKENSVSPSYYQASQSSISDQPLCQLYNTHTPQPSPSPSPTYPASSQTSKD